MSWIDPEEEARKHGYITDPAIERIAVRAIMRGVPLEKIIEQFGALPEGLMIIRRAPDLGSGGEADRSPPAENSSQRHQGRSDF